MKLIRYVILEMYLYIFIGVLQIAVQKRSGRRYDVTRHRITAGEKHNASCFESVLIKWSLYQISLLVQENIYGRNGRPQIK
jgi:hypothetical protein